MCPQNLGCAVTESCYLQRMTSEEGEVSFDSTLTPHGVEGTCEITVLFLGKRLGSCLDPCLSRVPGRLYELGAINPEALPEQFTVSHLPLAY